MIYERSLSGPHKYVGDFLSFVFIFAAAPQRRYTGLFVLPRKEVKCGFWLENAQHIYYFDVILNNRFLRERGMASTLKMEYQVFLCIFKRTQLWLP